MIPEISIIVPVYNAEKYLKECVDSILKQTFNNFELILIDDGSNDKSMEICENYRKMDSRVKVISKKNGGAASARNLGLDIARGRYIGFVDSDDIIHNRMYEVLYITAIENSSDIVICDFEYVYDRDINLLGNIETDKYINNFTNIEALDELCRAKDITFITPCNKLYSKKLFEHLRYIEGKICEDEFIAHRIFYNSKVTTYITLKLYYYFQSENSVMRSEFSIKKLESIESIKDRVEFFQMINDNNLRYKAEKLYVNVFLRDYYKAKRLLNGIDNELKVYRKDFISKTFNFIKNPLFTLKEKIMFLVFLIMPVFHEKYILTRNWYMSTKE